MFLKQYNYKPRSGSQSSEGGVERTDNAARADNPPAKAEPASPTAAATANAKGIAGRRRSSDTGKFAGLNGYKRNSQDADATARKASWAEQKPGQGGILSGMWESFTKGK